MSGGGAGLDSTSDANGPPTALSRRSRHGHGAPIMTRSRRRDTALSSRSRRGHDDTIPHEHDHDRHSADRVRARWSAITTGTVATFGHHARTVTVFTRGTSAGHPLFLDMNVYFRHRAGKLGGGAQGGIEVSYYSGGVMLSALACGREQLRMSPTNVTRARR